MVAWLGVLASVPIIYAGWVFFSNPQRGFRIYNWPFGPSQNEDGLTDAGKTPYRIRGALIIAIGLIMLLVSFFEYP